MPADPNRTGTHGKKHPVKHPRPKPGKPHHDHSHHRNPSWIKTGKRYRHHPGWIADAAIAAAVATKEAGFDGLDIISECSAIVADAFAAETLVAEEDGPELDPVVAVAYVAEGTVCAVLIFLLGICMILLGISLILTAVAIGVAAWRVRIGAVFDPFAKLMKHLIGTIGGCIEQTIHAPVVLTQWLFAKLANSIGLVGAPQWHHLWNTRIVPLIRATTNLHRDVVGINRVLFHGARSVLNRLAHLEHSLAQLWGIVNAFEGGGGGPSSAQLRAIEHRLNLQQQQVNHINQTLPHVHAHLQRLDREFNSLNHRVQLQGHSIVQLQSHVRAIEHTLAGLSPVNLSSIKAQLRQIEHELQSLGHFPLVHLENEIAALQRGISWLDSLHPGRVPGEIARIEAELKSIHAFSPAHLQHEIDVLTHRIDSMPRVPLHEIETELQRLQNEVNQLEHAPHTGGGLTPAQAAQLHSAYHISLGLAPLLALLPFSAEFIRNASKLRTCDPCKPNMGIVPPDIIDALVADFVAKDGF